MQGQDVWSGKSKGVQQPKNGERKHKIQDGAFIKTRFKMRRDHSNPACTNRWNVVQCQQLFSNAWKEISKINTGKSPIQIITYHPHVAAATIIPSHWHSPCYCQNVVASSGIEASTYNLVSEGGPLQVWSKVQPCPICVNLVSRVLFFGVRLDLSELSTKTWFVGSMIARHQSLKWTKALYFSVRFRTAATFGPEAIKLNPGLPPEHPSKWEWCSPQNSRERVTMTLSSQPRWCNDWNERLAVRFVA